MNKCTKCADNAAVNMILKDPETGKVEQKIDHCAEHFFKFCQWVVAQQVTEVLEEFSIGINAKRD